MLLEVRNLSRFFGGLRAVNDLSFTVTDGETVGIIGPNGAGKTTTFALLSGFLLPTSGEIRFRDELLNGLRPDQICQRGLTRTFQLVQPFPDLTTLENVMVGAFVRHPSVSAAEAKAQEVLRLVGLAERANTPARTLTIAERKRLEIARALATEPQLMMIDEVMAGLTPVETSEAIDLIRQLRAQGITFLIIEHVMKAVMSLSDRIIVLNYGEKIADGPPAQVARDERVIEAYLGEEALLA